MRKDKMVMTEKKTVYWNLVCWELRKLWEMPVLCGFVLLSIIFNILFVSSGHYGSDYIEFVKEARQTAGTRMGQEFDKKVAELPDTEEKEVLTGETAGAEDLFETYDPEETAHFYIGRFNMTGWTADALRQKYQKQKQRVRLLDETDAAMDVGAAGMTKPVFDMLFEKLCRAVLTEGIFLAVSAALYICRYEQAERTWLLVYASRRGRRLQKEKFVAGLLYALAAYAVMAAVSCIVFNTVWKPGNIWNTDMSTQFYYMTAMGMKVPFIAWVPLNMRGYLAAVLLLGAAVVLVFYMLGYLAGLTAKNSFAGFVALFVLCALNFEIVLLAGNRAWWGIFEAAMWTPVMFWWLQPLWFSDMGMNAAVPWQECKTGMLCLAAAGILLCLAFRYYYRKDLR